MTPERLAEIRHVDSIADWDNPTTAQVHRRELLAYVNELRRDVETWRNASKAEADGGRARAQLLVEADGRALAAETERDVALAERDQARDIARKHRILLATYHPDLDVADGALRCTLGLDALPAWLTDPKDPR